LLQLAKWLQSAFMNGQYQKALDYLYSFVNYEHKRTDQYSAEHISLERPRRLLNLLGDPHLSFRSIHIAGTKGKGSVAAMLATILRSAGLTVGLYTSPHLRDFRDRIRVQTKDDSDGRISQDQVTQIVNTLKDPIAKIPDLTWFELVTAMAFVHFAWKDVDVAIVEVGLGGRLDATNVLTPLVSVITSISHDHMALLGDTLEEIAAEKGGIIKAGIPVVLATQKPTATAVLEAMAEQKGAETITVGHEWQFEETESGESPWTDGIGPPQHIMITRSHDPTLIAEGTKLRLTLRGRHQQENAVLAIAAASAVRQHFPVLTVSHIKQGLVKVNWPGRMQVLAEGPDRPTLLVDCAHNVDSAKKLAAALLDNFRFDRLILVVGITADKDVYGILEALLPLADHIILTAANHPRASDPDNLLKLSVEMGVEAIVHSPVREAVRSAWENADASDLICVTGSIFVVGDLLNQWESLQSDFNQNYQGNSL